jgi:hypothetical protein
MKKNHGNRWLNRLLWMLLPVACLLHFSPAEMVKARQSEERKQGLHCSFQPFPVIVEGSLPITIPTGPLTLIPSVSDILTLAVGSREEVWLGTENGLVCAEMTRTKGNLFSTIQGLPFNRVTALVPFADTLWIGTSPHGPSNPAFGGLSAKDSNGFHLFGPRQGLVSNWIDNMLIIGHTIYINTPRGISFFDTASQKFIYRRDGLFAGNAVYDGKRFLMEAGTVMPTSSEIVSFNLETQVMSRYETKTMLGFDRLASIVCYNNQLWATGYRLEKGKPEPRFVFEGIHIFDCLSGKLTVLDVPEGVFQEKVTLRSLGPDLCFFSDLGFGFYREGALTFYRAGDSERPFIPELAALSAKGTLWMARSPYLQKFDRRGLTCYRITGCLSSNLITSMAFSQGFLWAGTEKGTIDRLSPGGEVLATYGRTKGLPTSPVSELFHDNTGILYACYEEGGEKKNAPHRKIIYRYAQGEDQWVPAPGYKGEQSLYCQPFPAKYIPILAKLRLDTPENKTLLLEERNCCWLSTYGCGIVRIGKP